MVTVWKLGMSDLTWFSRFVLLRGHGQVLSGL